MKRHEALKRVNYLRALMRTMGREKAKPWKKLYSYLYGVNGKLHDLLRKKTSSLFMLVRWSSGSMASPVIKSGSTLAQRDTISCSQDSLHAK
jgi:hypothetical protein